MNFRSLSTIAAALVFCLAGRTGQAQGILKTLVETGNRSQRINIVILAEGYTAAEQGKFDVDANKAFNALLQEPFYGDYKNFFNGYSIFVASNQSGSDHPSNKTFVDTYFNSSFGAAGLERVLTIPPNEFDSNYDDGMGKVMALLRNLLPEYNAPLVIVNDNTYGGTGGAVAVISTNANSGAIVTHELGHNLAHLGDEYSDPYPGYPDIEEPNTTKQTDPNQVKWKAWFTPGTPYPTPETQAYADRVGLFPGAHYHQTGWFRPQLNCKMKSLGVPFCKVCLEAGSLGFYQLTPPITSFTPANSVVTLNANGSQNFSVSTLTPATPLSIQWFLDGNPVAGQTTTAYTLNGSGLAAGPHKVSVVVKDVSGRVRTDVARASQERHGWSINSAGSLLNISTRLNVQTGNNVLIGGFITTGNEPKKVIVRAMGISLIESGIFNYLANPTVELHDATGAIVSSNDDWADSQKTEIQDSGVAPRYPQESAIVRTIAPGAYTAIVAGKNGGTGVGLVEVYDLEQGANSTLANISTRGFVDTGNNVMIGGFIIGAGSKNTQVVVRGIGPSLAQAGVSGALADPMLELHNGNGAVITANDNWQDDLNQAAQIQAAGLAPTNTRESALITTLTPGAYTAIIRGKSGTTGVALVEVYNLQ